MRPLLLIGDCFPGDPALDTAVSRALLERVAARELPETLRLARPGPMVAFGKHDVRCEGFSRAAAAARERGFEAITRLAGGRAAVFHEDTVAIAHAVAEEEPRATVRARFEETAAIVKRALRRLGVDARIGEVPGEYCPGEHSVSAHGAVKLAGIGQRVVARGAHVGGVVVADGATRIKDVLVPVYRELGLDWDPDTVGSVAAERAGIGFDAVRDALLAEYAESYELVEAAVDRETLALALALAAEHRV